MCHGLRNPLHAAMGLLAVLRSEDGIMAALRLLPAAAASRCATDIEALDVQLRAMRAVLNAVVDSQLLEAGEATVNYGPTDLQAIVRDVCQYHRGALKDGVELLVAVAANVPQIQSDGERIGQVRVRCAVRAAACCLMRRPGQCAFWVVLRARNGACNAPACGMPCSLRARRCSGAH